jgi:hypothetical protein
VSSNNDQQIPKSIEEAKKMAMLKAMELAAAAGPFSGTPSSTNPPSQGSTTPTVRTAPSIPFWF